MADLDFMERNPFGEYQHLLQELRLDDGRFQRYLRLSRTQFEDLLSHVGGQISPLDTNYRHCIPAAEYLSSVGKTTSVAISKIPIQFAFQVDPAAPSCSEGVYLPRFLVPTPGHGAQFYTPVSVALKINITAAATQSEITGLLVSGPYNVVKSSSGSGSFSLTWKPSASEDGQSHPICFVVQASFNSSVYQSELRCVVVTVRDKPVTSVNVLKMKISSALSLKDNHVTIENLIKEGLMSRGFPPGLTLRLLSNRP
ncbi:uncharacterized protein LOC124881062 [Girardinichthys multiradiatus]|uniref:uncharacterized protein LOC124881062 n=1 Tax=Girardinichthys multiradiatus TaxID=208333 RepID=UPI001FABDA27|nr:uncharacterized protein LOC124881062 [Girardinichthys multiradiatus]